MKFCIACGAITQLPKCCGFLALRLGENQLRFDINNNYIGFTVDDSGHINDRYVGKKLRYEKVIVDSIPKKKSFWDKFFG